tara:strand:- start:3192 stop:4739 length:1548 start_codon:yes stop_codon:yes gene_type:complete
MSAIITDQIRILNAKNFVAGVANTDNSYYSFIGLPNPSDVQTNWDTDPPTPKDSFDQENSYWDTMIAMKKINNGDIRQVVTKRIWKSGTKYDMYRHDYSRSNTSSISKATNLYNASFYVINEDYRVYICLQNGTSPDYPNGQISLDQPTFTDLEPRAAGTSNDGYVWKYLYTIKPNEIVKFETSDFIPVPQDWDNSTENAPVRENAIEGSIKIVTVTNAGVNVGAISTAYTRVPINGDGYGGEATVVVNNDLKIDSVTVSSQGSGYTYGTLDLSAGGVPVAGTEPEFNVIIPPSGGHGFDIYRELGAYNVLLYSRLENDTENPDFITGNQFSRIGVVENPLAPNSIIPLTLDKASAVNAIRLTGIGYSSATFDPDSQFTQTIGIALTAAGRVINYDQTTGVLKYWQDRVGFNTVGAALTNATYGYELIDFTSSPSTGGDLVITPTTGSNLQIYSGFSGFSTTINNKTYNLGQDFTDGISSPEVKRYSGNIIYVDNRPSVNRSVNQKEDIKVILQF